MESRTTRRALLEATPTTSVPSIAGSVPNILMTLHRRYEQTMSEYLIIEQAENAESNEIEKAALRRACKASCTEAEALRLAILHQVPLDLSDAAVLQFHIACAYDMGINCEDTPEAETEALTTAIDTLFDFLCCKMSGDHDRVGKSFKDGAIQSHFKRRRRTGLVED